MDGAHLVHLNKNPSFKEFNGLLKSERFWRALPGDYILMFQTDSLFVSFHVDDFVNAGWAYVGAPWKGDPSWGGEAVGNGGFSLRMRQAMVDVCSAWPDESGINEDIYFSYILQYSHYWVATVEVAKTFAAEQIPGENPVGVHQLDEAVARSAPWGTYEKMVTVYKERLKRRSFELESEWADGFWWQHRR